MESLAPAACTLPAAEQPLRLAEFDHLFSGAVRGVESLGATRARMRLTGEAGLGDTVRDLAARETACCSFLSFTTTSQLVEDAESVVLEIEVPPSQAGVLAVLVQRAEDRAAR